MPGASDAGGMEPASEAEPPGGPTGPVVAVADPGDARLAGYRDLRDAALRRRREAEEGVFVVEGRVAVRQLLGSPYEPCSLLVDDHQFEAVPDLVAAVRATGAPVFVAGRDAVAATVGFPLHRGVVALARRRPPLEAGELVRRALVPSDPGSRRPAVVAVVEGVNDHENLGALFRNAAAFGVGAVLLDPRCADPLYRRSVRVSAGHVLTVPFARLAPWPAALGTLRAAGLTVVALSPRPAGSGPAGSGPAERGPAERGPAERGPAADLRSVAGSVAGSVTGRGVAVLVGAEGPGLTAGALAAADAVAAVPMAPGVDSLNVATAAAIAFYELRGR